MTGIKDIDALNSRIAAALERIGGAVDRMGVRPEAEGEAPDDDLAALREALEEEKLANAQLEERLKTIKARHAAEIEAIRAEAAETRPPEDNGELARLDTELQRLRQANDQLRAANAALREANEAGVGEPHLINKAMLAELEGLRAARAADVAEANTILSRLQPLMEAARDHLPADGTEEEEQA